MEIHVDITVTGLVQGVGYRAGVLHKAKGLNLKGWVKNQLDGSVEIHAEGREENILQLLSWCSQGTFLSKVTQVTSRRSALIGYQTFKVER